MAEEAADLLDEAVDFAGDFVDDIPVDSFITDFGEEFLTDFGTSDLWADFADFGGDLYEQVGDWAGDADWFDANFFGDIVDEGFTDFGTSDLFADFGGDVFDEALNFGEDLFDDVLDYGTDLWEDFRDIGGDFLDDTWTKVSDKVSDWWVEATDKFSLADTFEKAVDKLVPTQDQVVDWATKQVKDAASGLVMNGVALAVNSTVGKIPVVGEALAGSITQGITQPLGTAIYGNGFSIGNVFTGIGSNLANIPGQFGNTIVNNVTGYAQSTIQGGIQYVQNTATGAVNTAVAQIPVLGTGAAYTVAQSFGDTGGYFIKTGSIPTVSTNAPTAVNPVTGEVITNPSVNGVSAYAADGKLNPGWSLNVDTGQVTYVGTTTVSSSSTSTVSSDSVAQPLGPDGQKPYDSASGNLNAGWILSDNGTPLYVGNVLRSDPTQVPYSDRQAWPGRDAEGNLLPGWATSDVYGDYYVGKNTNVEALVNTDSAVAAARKDALVQQARQQFSLQNQRKQANDGDWRVKLRLAPGANYLYRANDGLGSQAGILQPLAVTDGVIFPYTPTISTVYKANYNAYDLTHSNYRGYFYQGSSVGEISIQAVFTAQDTAEANYLLAVIHFFRSVTKMFYGQDTQRGAPPPLVFLQGLGTYQFNLHPCVVSQFTYNLPADVDYIRAGSPNINGSNMLIRRDRQSVATNVFSSAWQRLMAAGVPKGGVYQPNSAPTLGLNSPTYVPTKIQIDLVLLPMQSRTQVSQQFSLQNFANGNLIRGGTNQPGGFW